MANVLTGLCANDEMAHLYGRFATVRKYARPEVQKAWGSLSTMQWRSGMQEKKAKALAMQVAKPHTWEQFLLTETHEIRKETIDEVKKVRFYPGQLEQIHGKDEADWLIRSGKLEETEDSDEDIRYVKKRRRWPGRRTPN